jgi:hypothetical protein
MAVTAAIEGKCVCAFSLIALKLYLTGDAGARAIRVMEVREDES